MIKKQLLTMKPLFATDEMKEMVRLDVGKEYTRRYSYTDYVEKYMLYERYLYFKAIVQNEILKIACFTRKDIARRCYEPEYEIYISKSEEKWLTYSTKDRRWLTAKIDNLQFDLDKGWTHGNYPWQSEGTRKIVNDYLGTENLTVKMAVLTFQNEVKREEAKKKTRSVTERIDRIMENVPDLPKDFDDWVVKSAFSKEKCLFYHYGTDKGFCSACESEVQIKKKIHHGDITKCPKCKKEVVAKAWKKQKYIQSRKWIGILQRLDDKSGYVLRLFDCFIKRKLECDWKMVDSGFWEQYRIILNNDFVQKEFFQWGESKRTGIDRWNRPEDIKGSGFNCYYAPSINDECILYHRNIWRLRQGTFAKYIPLEKILQAKQGDYCNPIRMMGNIRKYPQTEYFIKAGLTKLAYQILEDRGSIKDKLDFSKKKLWEVMGIERGQVKRCIEMDISCRGLEILKVANKCKVDITNEQLEFYRQYLDKNLANTLFKFGHHEKMYRYIQEELKGDGRQLGDYLDYLGDLEYLQINIGKSELFPKGFQTVHHNVAMQRQERENKLAKMKLDEKNAEFQKMLPAVQEIYSLENEQFKVVIPTCKEDFQVEGRMNHNCVGGSYFDKMLQGKCVVFFLRKKENIDEAYCTVEMSGSSIVQCRAIRNNAAPPEAMKFMELVSKEVQKRIEKKQEELRQRVAV